MRTFRNLNFSAGIEFHRLGLVSRISFLLLLFALAPNAYAEQASQDTLQLTIKDAETKFLANNLSLIIQRYNIEAANAYSLQASLFTNIDVQVEHNLNNKITGRALEAGAQGETMAQVGKLFRLAGKRNKQIALTVLNAQLSQQQLYDIIRALKYSLRSSFYQLYYLQQSEGVYKLEVENLSKTISLYQTQYENGNIAFKEVIRLRSFLLSLESERKDLRQAMYQAQSDLMVLIGDTTVRFIKAQVDTAKLSKASTTLLDFAGLLELAIKQRPDLAMAKTRLEYSKASLAFEKVQAVPDLRISGTWDKNGNLFPNYFGIQLASSIPAFNRNQGNIKASEYLIKSAKAQYDLTLLQAERDIMLALNQSLETERLYTAYSKDIPIQFQKLMTGINDSYLKRNISLLEFLDYYESYKNSIRHVNDIYSQRLVNFEQINYFIGTDVISY